MQGLRVFQNAEFGSLRTVVINNEPWFSGKDVATALGFANSRKAIGDHVDNDDKNTVTFRDGIQGNPNMTVINESGVYSLIFGSRLPSAKRFKHWVTSEVLPTIRKDGGYIADDGEMSEAEIMSKALEIAHRTLEKRERQIKEMTPKALFADAVATSKTSILVGEMAKILRQNNVPDMGEKRLFKWLRENGYLGKVGNRYNVPNQIYMDMGLFEIKETTVNHPDGHITVNRTAKITGKGQQYFINKFLRGRGNAKG